MIGGFFVFDSFDKFRFDGSRDRLCAITIIGNK